MYQAHCVLSAWVVSLRYMYNIRSFWTIRLYISFFQNFREGKSTRCSYEKSQGSGKFQRSELKDMTEKLSEDSTPYDTDMEITYDRSKERTRSQENAINMEGLTPWERRLRRRAQAWFEEDTQAQTRFDTYFFKIFVRISSKGIALATCVEGSHWRGLTNRSCISCIY